MTKEEKYKRALEEIREEIKDFLLLGFIRDIVDKALEEDTIQEEDKHK